MPSLSHHDESTSRFGIYGGKLFFCLLDNIRLNLLPLAVQFAQHQRDIPRLAFVLGHQKFDAAHRRFKTPGCVQPRRKHETDLPARHVFSAKSRNLNELPQPLDRCLFHARQSDLDQLPILRKQRHDIGDRP